MIIEKFMITAIKGQLKATDGRNGFIVISENNRVYSDYTTNIFTFRRCRIYLYQYKYSNISFK